MSNAIVFKINSDNMKVGEMLRDGRLLSSLGTYACGDKQPLSGNICIMDLVGRTRIAVIFTFIDYNLTKNHYHKISAQECTELSIEGVSSVKTVCEFLKDRVALGDIDLYIVQLDLGILPARRVIFSDLSNFD